MRKFVKVIERAVFVAAVAVGAGFGENSGITLTPSGFAALREGQVVKGELETIKSAAGLADVDYVWIQGMDIGYNVQAKYNDLPVTANLGMEMLVCNDNTSYPQDLGQSRRLFFYPYLSRADVQYTWGDKDNPSLFLNAGYFPCKYNNDVRNLGEYLFRSGTYPQYLITNFDFPMARLMGARLGGSPWKSFNWDVLLTLNNEWTAIGDPNLSALLSWKPIPMVELGMGGSWCSFLSFFGINLDKTSPKEEGNDYLAPVPGHPDSMAIYYYTFAGQKVMGRISLDLKQLFPGNDFFGEHDLKLYSEAAILGLVNYPISIDGYTQYDTISQRIPIMCGINWPNHPLFYSVLPGLSRYLYANKIFTLKMDKPLAIFSVVGLASGTGMWLLEKYFKSKIRLDILSIEGEYYPNPYPGSLNPIKFDNQPIALSSYGNEKSPYYLNKHGDDWKWSIYGKKTFAQNFNMTFQLARDHFRWFRMDYTAADGKEALRKNDEWYYTFKFGYTF